MASGREAVFARSVGVALAEDPVIGLDHPSRAGGGNDRRTRR